MWHGIIRSLNIQHFDCNKKLIWEAKDLKNMLHTEGELFCLNALFTGGNNPSQYIPNNYYFGLDARSTIAAGDTMSTIATNGEPSTNGYSRQLIPSGGQFSITLISGIYQANSPIISFLASGGSWGPVNNLFLTDMSDNTGDLIASVALTQPMTVNSGETVTMRMGLSLRDAPLS